MQKHIATTRFNNKTWKENYEFIKRNDKKCIYSVESINAQIPTQTIFFVLEMNNDENRIMGIGLVKNNPKYKKYNVHENDKYNKYSYIGNYRIDRKEMTPQEEVIMKVFDKFCFKGCYHLKRLKGIKIFPKSILNECNKVLDLTEYITNMFKRRFSTEEEENKTKEDK